MHRRYLDHFLADLAHLVATLHTDFPALQGRLALWSRDGYPTGSSGTRRGGTIGDPTASAVLASDEVRRDRQRLEELVVRAHDLLKEADTIRGRYMSAAAQVTKHNQALTKCANIHGCPDDGWASKAGRCATCYEYVRRTERDRTTRRTDTRIPFRN